jgi:hypothetical protein
MDDIDYILVNPWEPDAEPLIVSKEVAEAEKARCPDVKVIERVKIQGGYGYKWKGNGYLIPDQSKMSEFFDSKLGQTHVIKELCVPVPEGWPGLTKIAEHRFDPPLTVTKDMNINQALMSQKGAPMREEEYIAFRKAERLGFTRAFGDGKLRDPYNDGSNGAFTLFYGTDRQKAALEARRAEKAIYGNNLATQAGFRPAPVLNKKDYYARYIDGEFGNRLQVWRTCEEYVNSGFTKPIGIRNVKADSPFCRYDIPPRMVMPVVQEFMTKGCPLGDMTFTEAAPDTALIIQGEIIIYRDVLELTYSKVKRQMRIALKEKPEYASGNHAHQILKHCCDTNSYEWMMWLLEAYEDHAVEFSTYNRYLGNIPRRNTLIWEVRKY